MGSRQVFQGVKIVDFSWVAVGPQVTRELAEHGATVVRVECHRRPDTLRLGAPFKDGIRGIDRSAFGTAYNTNKYGISLDLNRPRGREIAKKLVSWADIVADSMTPGTLAQWGLDYESCRKIKLDIIYFSTCQLGQTGPYSQFGAYGMFSASMAGFADLTGWPDREPCALFNNYTDFIAPFFIVVPLVAALLRRQRTGKGMYMEQSQMEAGLAFLGPAILDFLVNSRELTRQGNKDPYMAPHGVFPCLGEDEWIAIAVTNEKEWRGLLRVIGKREWLKDKQLSTLPGRKEKEQEIEAVLAAWTKTKSAQEVMETLQAAGVPAGVVERAGDLFADPQLQHRQHFQVLSHPVIGPHSYHAPAYRLSRTPCQLKSAGPALGEHNEYVFKEILGLSDDEIADLLIEGVITTEADVPSL